MIRRFIRCYYKSIIIGGLILWLSLSEDSSLSPGNFLNIPNSDKAGHFLIYLFFTSILLLDSCRWQKENPLKYVLLVIPVCLGALMELLQALITTTRHADILDMAANFSGIVSGVIVSLILRTILTSKKSDL